ncbi:MAG: glycosyltransferase family 2 protein [Bacteroidota bacterium]|nr:glycosyltransferase family 2 protein [Bacteroidota bacterium]
MSVPRVTVIIVSWNALPIVRRCLPSVARTRWPSLELVLADNASTDGTAAWVQQQFPQIRLIRHPENWKFSRGNNEAIRQTEGDYIVLLNNDVEVPPDWLEPLVARAESNRRIAAVQPKILQFEQRQMFEYAGAAGGYLDRLGYPFARGRIFDSLESDTGQYDTSVDLDWASGAALLLRRSALAHAGLLDEQFEMHMEEIDLCWRLRTLGYRITIAPLSRVYHIGGASLDAQSPRKLYYNVRNSLVMLRKNLSVRAFRLVYWQRLMMDHGIAKTWLTRGRWARGLALYRAYWDATPMMKTYTPPTESGALPSYRRSILIDHVLRRKRVFSDLNPGDFR